LQTGRVNGLPGVPGRRRAKLCLAVFTWIESWCTPRKPHSGLNDQSPNNVERRVYGVLCKRGCDQSLGILPSN
jgi:hypothetical protein